MRRVQRNGVDRNRRVEGFPYPGQREVGHVGLWLRRTPLFRAVVGLDDLVGHPAGQLLEMVEGVFERADALGERAQLDNQVLQFGLGQLGADLVPVVSPPFERARCWLRAGR